jgi:hypothetical protein
MGQPPNPTPLFSPQSIAGVEGRLEALATATPLKSEVVLTSDLEVRVGGGTPPCACGYLWACACTCGCRCGARVRADCLPLPLFPASWCLALTIAFICVPQALLTEHAHELDGHLDRLKAELLAAIGQKVGAVGSSVVVVGWMSGWGQRVTVMLWGSLAHARAHTHAYRPTARPTAPRWTVRNWAVWTRGWALGWTGWRARCSRG